MDNVTDQPDAARLLELVREMPADSTVEAARDVDAEQWLARWLERPQPALGGRAAREFVNSPEGVEMVARLLGSAVSGSYQ
jgi:uncharacterized protein (DUF2384 family)